VIVDSSAIVAIVHAEPDAARYAAALARSQDSTMSAANWLETALVVDSARDPLASRRFDELTEWAGIQIAPVTHEQAVAARQAYRDFGRGSTSPAKLNFGDCFAYALASERREPLLFKGDDFIHTDVEPAELPLA
jgi:ribonuclease VapC